MQDIIFYLSIFTALIVVLLVASVFYKPVEYFVPESELVELIEEIEELNNDCASQMLKDFLKNNLNVTYGDFFILNEKLHKIIEEAHKDKIMQYAFS